jgi:Protein tyrosine and serine/threonine kinase
VAAEGLPRVRRGDSSQERPSRPQLDRTLRWLLGSAAMAQLEFLERMEVEAGSEVWIVRDGGVVRNAYVHDDEGDREWLELVKQGTSAWIGFRHPRVGEVLRCDWIGGKLVVVVSDQRGLSMLRAAKQLPSSSPERERWAVSEILGNAEALAAMALHQPGFVHRRATHEQLVVSPDGRVRLRAPIAHASSQRRGTWVGQPRGISISVMWMAPEQLKGLVSTPASDVYQLAATLYAALCDRAPFPRGSHDGDFELMNAILHGPMPPAPPVSDPGLAAVVMRGLAREPEARFPDPAAFAAALRGCAPGEPSSATFERVAKLSQGVRPAPMHSAAITGDRCRRRWEHLTPTADDGIRHCASCQHEVVQVRSIEALIPLLGKRCVSFQEIEENEN